MQCGSICLGEQYQFYLSQIHQQCLRCLQVWHRQEWGLVPTGRITFRGYYTEYWYAEERDWCVKEADEVNEEV